MRAMRANGFDMQSRCKETGFAWFAMNGIEC